jgi:uncharacterized protein YycO
MKVIAIIFVHNPVQWKFPLSSVFVWPLIRLVTGSKWNHCAMLCVKDGGEMMIIEALGKGVVKTSTLDWLKRATRDTEQVQVNIACDWLEDTIGLPYDYASLLWWKVIKMATGRWFGPQWDKAKKAVFCSELCAMVVEHPEPWGVSPQDLYKYLNAKDRVVLS